MRRAFPILASIAGLLMVSSLVLDLLGSTNRLAWVSVAAILVVHGGVFASLLATGRRVEAEANRLAMPDWVTSQTEKTRWKAFVYVAGGSLLAILAGRSSGEGWWPLLISAASLSFQLGAFVGEFVILVSQSRSVAEFEEWSVVSGRWSVKREETANTTSH